MSATGSGRLNRSAWLSVVLWVAVILVITSWPSPPIPQGTPTGLDKVVHFSMYAVLGGLVGRAADPASGRRSAQLIAVMACFAAADEVHQRWIPGRGPDVGDWLADLAGATAGLLAMPRRARVVFSSN
jgi:VanZ family protein